MNLRIIADAASGASGTTAWPHPANRSNRTRWGGRAAAMSAWHTIGVMGSSSPPITRMGYCAREVGDQVEGMRFFQPVLW